jgi:hypothetical protein
MENRVDLSQGRSFALSLIAATFTCVAVWPASVVAQGNGYTFTRMIGPSDVPEGPIRDSLQGNPCVSMNNLGQVVAALGSSIWVADGENAPIAVALETSTERPGANICASINDLGEVAYLVGHLNSAYHTSLVRNANGVQTTLVTSSSQAGPLDGGRTYLPSLSNAGSAVYQSGENLYIAPAIAPVFPVNSFPFATTASMNDSGVVAFLAIRLDPTAPSGARVGIYRGSSVPLVEDGVTVDGVSCCGSRPVINNTGTVAFVASVAGRVAIFKTDDGVNLTQVSATGGEGISEFQRFSIDNHGQVAYQGAAGGGWVLFVGPDLVANRVIGFGDELDGSTVEVLSMAEEAFNDRGQLAFWARLADGRVGIYRAEPSDTTPPVVTPPSAISIEATENSGARGSSSPQLAAFLAGGSATDNLDPSPERLAPHVNNVDVDNVTLFPIGTTTVTFRFRDATGNIGTADSNVEVTSPPTCAVDVTSSVSVVSSSLRLDRKSGHYFQKITLRNTSADPIVGPVSLVFDSLTPGTAVVGSTGLTACAAPAGSPYVAVNVGTEAILSSRERSNTKVEFEIEFVGPAAITYVPRVLAGTGSR